MTLPCPRRAETHLEITPPDSDKWDEARNTCTYCGSMNPDEFMSSVESGSLLIPTDKDYKVYVGESRQKFYFQHLSTDQKKRFVEMINKKELHFGVPGYFYVLPFFVVPK